MSGVFSQHVGTPERTRQRMSTELAELRKQRKAHAKRDREKQQRRKRAEEEQAAKALVLLALTMPATNCLRSFLERSGKDELSASDTDTAVAATVDQLLAMTTAQTVRLLEPRRAVEAARLRAAQAFSIEHGVHVWVAEKHRGLCCTGCLKRVGAPSRAGCCVWTCSRVSLAVRQVGLLQVGGEMAEEVAGAEGEGPPAGRPGDGSRAKEGARQTLKSINCNREWAWI